MKKHHYSKEI